MWGLGAKNKGLSENLYSQPGNPAPSPIQLQNPTASPTRRQLKHPSRGGEHKKDLQILTFEDPQAKQPSGSLNTPSTPIKKASHKAFNQHLQCLTFKQKGTARIIISVKPQGRQNPKQTHKNGTQRTQILCYAESRAINN